MSKLKMKQHDVSCPTCNAPAKMTWSGLELVENTGDETLASKHYQYNSQRIAELEEALRYSTELIKEGADWADKLPDVRTVDYCDKCDLQVKENEQLISNRKS